MLLVSLRAFKAPGPYWDVMFDREGPKAYGDPRPNRPIFCMRSALGPLRVESDGDEVLHWEFETIVLAIHCLRHREFEYFAIPGMYTR